MKQLLIALAAMFALGQSAMADTITTTTIATAPTGPAAIAIDNGTVTVHITKGDAGSIIPEGTIEQVCAGHAQQITSSPLKGMHILYAAGLGRLYVGHTWASFQCPLPAYFKGLQSVWMARHGEHHPATVFSEQHLREMVKVIEADKPVLLTPQRLRGYGEDKPMILATMREHLGQFWAYTMEKDDVLFIVPVTSKLSACQSGVCHEWRWVAWHLHLRVQHHTIRHHKPKPPRPAPDAITMICSAGCKNP